MENIVAVIALAVLVEAIVEGLKGALCGWDWVSLALGAGLCLLAEVDVFALAGVRLSIPYVGAALTGLIAGRGASVVFDLWDTLKKAASDSR